MGDSHLSTRHWVAAVQAQGFASLGEAGYPARSGQAYLLIGVIGAVVALILAVVMRTGRASAQGGTPELGCGHTGRTSGWSPMRTERPMPRTTCVSARDADPKLMSMSETNGSGSDSSSPPSGELLPPTAYAVLGILSVNDEELAPGEIKLRAEFAFRHFYWSPAVSHIRRELRRLLEMGLVAEREITIGQVRRSQVYRTTAEGERALAHWVAHAPLEESVVVKNSVLLRVYLGDKAPRETILSVIDARLGRVEEDIREARWGRRRSAELGLDQAAYLRFPMAVSEYKLRSLYFEQGNLRQLRDTIVGFDTESFKQDDTRKRGPLRRRQRE